jgi:hypothetical protein
MRHILNKIVDKIKTRFMFKNVFSEYHAIYEIMSKKCGGGREMTSQYGEYALHSR